MVLDRCARAYRRKPPAGETLTIRASAWPGETFTATVDQVADALDSVSRTLKIRAHLRNPERHLKAEMYVTAEFVRPADSALDVPASAVYLHEGAQRVFVRTAPAQYTRKTVTGIASGNDRVATVGHHFVPRSEAEVTATRSLPEAMPVTVLRVYCAGAVLTKTRCAPSCRYTRKTVTGIASGNDRVAIVSGLKQGDEVVTDGALYLQQLLDTANRPDK